MTQPEPSKRRQLVLIDEDGQTAVTFTARIVGHLDPADPNTTTVTFEDIEDWKVVAQ